MKAKNSGAPLYSCTHPGMEELRLADYLGRGIMLRLCRDCKKIPEFAALIEYNRGLGDTAPELGRPGQDRTGPAGLGIRGAAGGQKSGEAPTP